MVAEDVLLIGFRVLVFREAEETAAGVKENGQVLERFLFATQYIRTMKATSLAP